jgi:hypothetical protein
MLPLLDLLAWEHLPVFGNRIMIPTVESLKSSKLTHRFGDIFNPPGLTNFLGCVQVDLDPVAIRSHNYPPFATSDTVTGKLFWNDRIFGALGVPVSTTWYPDRIEREAAIGEFRLTSITAMAVARMGTIVRLTIENRAAGSRHVQFKLGIRGNVTQARRAWTDALPPLEKDNEARVDVERGAVVFSARNSRAVVVQGAFPRPARITMQALHFEFDLRPGETRSIAFVAAVGESADEANEVFDALSRNSDTEIARARDEWNAELAACFTPDNSRYSGFMPTLETSDADILKNYHMGILGTIYFKRDSPYSVHGRAYTTLMPRNWQPVTFLWDYSLSSLVHSLLDPREMISALKRWMTLDIHKHFGTEFLTGGGVGPWYAVNDYAMTTIAYDYFRFNGGFEFLNAPVNGSTVREYLQKYATNWRQFKTKNGLADYGGLLNLLECVNSYVHEVASLNAANAFALRAVADILENGDKLTSADVLRSLRIEAAGIIARVHELYVSGKGYWNARDPDGATREVRHCYDLLAVLNSIPADLSEAQKREMCDFFTRELKTKNWMIALAAGDDDAIFDIRADHQWTGAYTAWPPMTALGLYKIGRGDLAFDWYKAMASSANQGPFGQAQIADGILPLEEGGARKAPQEFPQICDWTCSSCGAWCNVVLEGIFGIRAGMNQITAKPEFHRFDPDSRLTNLRHQGKRYMVDRNGLRAQ